MDIKGNTIYFKYNAKDSIKTLFRVGLFVFLLVFVIGVIICICLKLSLKNDWITILSVLFGGLPISLFFWIPALVQKNRDKKELFISVSPKGMYISLS